MNMDTLVPLLQILLGLLPLLFGRQLFWLFVGITGFLIGILLGEALFPDLAPLIRLLISLGIGVIGALLAVAIQVPMAMVAGFLALGGVGLLIANSLAGPPWLRWLLFFGLGLLGAVLVAFYFDWALIIVSSIQGAGAITGGVLALLPGRPLWLGLIVWLTLLAVGIMFQSGNLAQPRRRSSA